ncbi:3-oxoacid CoA-transferase subunit A [Rossellomorea aquimaris]|uniref:3-oxoacid CoA-transferase subunit A n=1 Tax=Rossellomorea aquimaris TaxID=189382 RepID=UPI0007D08B45|nr:CoA transferase subunit A [Rossellomorea aquimaris]
MTSHHSKVRSYADIRSFFYDGMTLMFGGFGGVGTPPSILTHLIEWGYLDLTIIGNDTGFPHIGIGQLIAQNRVKKVIASHIGSNPIAGQLMSEGKLEVEFSPQGILAERIRAGGVGIKGIVTEIGVEDPYLNKGKEILVANGERYLFESSLVADVGIVYAKKADSFGNLIYDKSARNTNPLVAMAADITIVEAEEVVGIGELDPEEIVTSGVFVDHIVRSKGVDWEWVWEMK